MGGISVLEKCLCQKGVCIRETSALERCVQGRIYPFTTWQMRHMPQASRFTVPSHYPKNTPFSIKTRSLLSASRVWGLRANVCRHFTHLGPTRLASWP